MNKRLAFIAAGLAIVLNILFLALTLGYARHTLSLSALSDLRRIGALVASGLPKGAQTPGADGYVKDMAVEAEVYALLLDAKGKVLYNSVPPSVRTYPGVRSRQSLNPMKWQDEMASAHTLTDGGRLVVVSVREWGAVLFLEMRVPIMLMIVMLPLLLLILIALIRGRRADLLTKLRLALTEFAVGDYTSRIDEDGDPASLPFNELFQQIEQNIAHDKRRADALNTVINRAQSGILSIDADMRVIIATSRAKRLLGIVGSPEGLHIDEVMRDVQLEPMFRSAMDQEGVYTNEIATRTAGGRAKRPLRLYITPMRQSDGEPLGAVAFVEDITELRRLEQVRTDFAANVSHELKTPLTSIKGFVETLQAGAIDQPELAQKFLRIISMEAERLTRLINDILSISKLESGSDEVSMSAIRLDKLAADVVDMLRMNAAEKQIEIYLTENTAPALIWGNRDRVDQMLINLIDNAVKYTLDGGSVTVSVFRAQDQVYLSVSDTGIGIAEEHMPRLFERFYRVDKGRSRSMGGTGLGLAIVKHIVNSMGGSIEVHSKLNKGTEFLIQLPTCPEDKLTGDDAPATPDGHWDDMA